MILAQKPRYPADRTLELGNATDSSRLLNKKSQVRRLLDLGFLSGPVLPSGTPRLLCQDWLDSVYFYPSTASTNQLVMDVGCVMAVPTTTAQAPVSMAAFASAGVWTRPSQMTGLSGNSVVAWRTSATSGPSVMPQSIAAPGCESVVEAMSHPMAKA